LNFGAKAKKIGKVNEFTPSFSSSSHFITYLFIYPILGGRIPHPSYFFNPCFSGTLLPGASVDPGGTREGEEKKPIEFRCLSGPTQRLTLPVEIARKEDER